MASMGLGPVWYKGSDHIAIFIPTFETKIDMTKPDGSSNYEREVNNLLVTDQPS